MRGRESGVPGGTIVFVDDPFEVHTNPRPVVVCSPENRPFGDEECTIVCLGTDATEKYELSTPLLPNEYVHGVSFRKKTYVLPWALYTIPRSTIDESTPVGRLADEGMKIVAQSVYRMMRTGL